MDSKMVVNEIFEKKDHISLQLLLERLDSLNFINILTTDSVSSALIDIDFLEEIRRLVTNRSVSLYFGKTLRDLKCIIQDESLRDHEIYFYYNAPRRLSIKSIAIPHSPLQDREYINIEEIITLYTKHLNNLEPYFFELERIDRFCTVMEPVEPSFQHDYRKILLDDRTWLHVEVTPDGMATNIHLVGQCEQWKNKLQVGLLVWDHDKDIVENIMTVFDLENFPAQATNIPGSLTTDLIKAEIPVCNICLCVELPDKSGVPQPLCQNTICGVYFHRNCLFQWLVACSGGRPPAFGVVTGSCPTCLQPIACSEKDC